MSTLVENVTCLGCGCACDDIAIRVDEALIVETRNACSLGSGWFRAERSTSRTVVDGQDATLERAIGAAAKLLQSSRRPAIFVASALSCEEQRACVAIADVLRARLDSSTTMTALPHVLASQERGFATATFGEVRNRADLVVYWGVDIQTRYPRFVSRYAPTAAPATAVDVGSATASVDAAHRFSVDPANELATLIALRSSSNDGIGALFADKQYIALIYDAEPDERAARSPQRFDALIALAQSLNDRTRCAAIALRQGGNVSGADSVFTASGGYPTAIDFGRGYPQYRPHGTLDADVVLVIGNPAMAHQPRFDGASTIAIGPNATSSTLGPATIAIDTGAAGIHIAGTAVRADDVPLPLRPSLSATRSVGDVLTALVVAVR